VKPSAADGSNGAERSASDAEPGDEHATARAAVRAVRGGDREAFGQLLRLYQHRLFGLTLMMVRDPAAAEEVTQDAFVRAYTRLELYDVNRPFYPWLATIGVRLAQNWLRRRGRIDNRDGASIDPEREPDPGADPLDRVIAEERGRQLWDAVAALPSGERTAVTLYYRQGMKVREIAHALGVTSGTVKTFLFRARRKLRAALDTPADARNEPEETS
jgi:RNA polymerase sigma-70 factor (ECF subfamily)